MKNMKKGFSLIELLVVVAIISLLVSILLPSLEAAREMARTVVCQSNLRNFWCAFEGYSRNNDEFYPPAYRNSYWRDGAYSLWFHGWNYDCYPMIGYYMRTELDIDYYSGAWHCPTSQAIPGMNAWLPVAGGASSSEGFWHPYLLGRPADTFLLGDGQYFFFSSGDEGSMYGPNFCHNDGLNLLFVDGHVERWSSDAFPGPHTAADYYRTLAPWLGSPDAQ